MSATKPQPHRVGTAVSVTDGGTVVRPDSSEVTVTGGAYILDQPGTFLVDGVEVTAK